MPVTRDPNTPTYTVGQAITLIGTGSTADATAQVVAVDGIATLPDSDVLAEQSFDQGGNVTFSGFVVPAYNVGGIATIFKIVDTSNLNEEFTDSFKILAARGQQRLSIGMGIGL